MMLAIIIPYYKLSFFEETLNSLSNQTDKRFKVYLGDDASPENPTYLLEKFNGKFEYQYVKFDTNEGRMSLVNQWHRCIDLANEDWIMILGDDDILSHNLVADFYKNLPEIESYKSNVVRFSTKIIDGSGKLISDTYNHPKTETAIEFLCRKFSKQTRSSLSEHIFKRAMVVEKRFRNFPLAWHSDDMAVIDFSESNNIYSINSSFVSVRVSEISLTGDEQFMKVKNEATFQFCGVLFKEYATSFSKIQKKIILKKLEMAYFNIPSFNNYLVISSYYCNRIGLVDCFKFQFRLFKVFIISVLEKLHLLGLVQKVFFLKK
ncbi:glycosyltransferase family 2 protein [Flavobacterium koreense]